MVIISLHLLKHSNRVKKAMSKKEDFVIIIGSSDLYFKAARYSAVVSLSSSSNAVTKDDHISSIRHSQSLICCWICAMCALMLTFFSSHMCISGDVRQILVYTILQ